MGGGGPAYTGTRPCRCLLQRWQSLKPRPFFEIGEQLPDRGACVRRYPKHQPLNPRPALTKHQLLLPPTPLHSPRCHARNGTACCQTLPQLGTFREAASAASPPHSNAVLASPQKQGLQPAVQHSFLLSNTNHTPRCNTSSHHLTPHCMALPSCRHGPKSQTPGPQRLLQRQVSG